MKNVIIIPARYGSTRLPGKPLVDICGETMLYRVYSNLQKSKKFHDIIVAIDDNRIEELCKNKKIKYIMTSSDHPNHISRVWEVSKYIEADYYICVNGDEPLINYKDVEKIIPTKKNEIKYFIGAYRNLTDPAETNDSSNIKVILNKNGKCIYMSRTPIPYPKNSLNFQYKKYVGIECFTKKGLDIFQKLKPGNLEKTEDIDHLRFIENNCEIFFKEINSNSISVDTQKDLEKVINIFESKKNR